MLYILALLGIIMSFLLKKNKFVKMYDLTLIFILIGWSYNNADYLVHLRRYNEYASNSWQTEPLFTFIVKTFNLFSFSYNQFLVVFALFVIYSFYRFIKKNTQYKNFVLALYLIFPLCMDTTMVRYTLATAIAYLFFDKLYEDDIKSLFIYILGVLISSLVHYSTIFFLLFIIPRFLERKKLIVLVFLENIIFLFFGRFFLFFSNELKNLTFLNIGKKISIVLDFSKNTYSIQNHINYIIKICIISWVIIFTLYLIKKSYKSKGCSKHEKYIARTLNINITCLFILPLILIIPDLFRIQLSLLIINYTAVAMYFEDNRSKNSLKRVLYVNKQSMTIGISTLIFSLLSLYFWVLSSENINTVFKALFENNIFFK